MRRISLSLFLTFAAFLVAPPGARAFIGGSGTGSDLSFAVPGPPPPPGSGICSVTGAPCGPPLPACPLAPGENCLLPSYGSSLTFTQDGTSGESSAVQSGFYECKAKTSATAPAPVKVNEDTLLVLVNEHAAASICACIVQYDGTGVFLAANLTDLPGMDVDELALCSITPFGPGGFTGHVKVITAPGICAGNPFSPLQGGAYAWIKDAAYKGTKKNPVDPFSAGNVTGVGKTELRVTPAGVDDGSAWAGTCSAAPILPAAFYVEATFP